MRSTVLLAALVLSITTGATADDDITSRMASAHAGDVPSPTAEATTEPTQPVTAATVTYATVNGKAVTGYLARPVDGAGPFPGLIVIHEWWGLNDNIRSVTRRLAGEGYSALAVDLYGGTVADTPASARTLMQATMGSPGPARENLHQAYDYLTNELHAPRVGVIGWCFGGGWALQTAIMLPKQIQATVMYYGKVETDPDVLRPIRGPLLGLFGANDHAIPPKRVQAFKQALGSAGVDAEVVIYPDVGHAFANPSGTSYDPAAAADAWRRTVAFLAANLEPAPPSTAPPTEVHP